MNELQELKDNFPSNSNKSKEKAEIEPIENDRKIKRITVGKQKKKSEIRKFTDVFLADDLNSVKDYTDNLDKVTCPALVLCGEKDNVNKKAAVKVAEKLSKAKFSTIDNSGHEVNIDNPNGLAKAIVEL